MDKKNGNKDHWTILNEGSIFEGSMVVPHSIKIDGSFKGKIETKEDLNIGDKGVVEAEIKAKNVVIGGKVIGNVIAIGRVELKEHASLTGDLSTRDLVIHEGALYHGKCSMKEIKPNA